MMDISRLRTYLKGFVTHRWTSISKNIQPKDKFHTAIIREQALADRNQHPFSLILFKVSDSKASIACAQHLAEVLIKRIRLTDEVGWYDNRCIGVLLPYTPITGAQRLVNDIYEAIDTKAQPSECNIYTYPNKWLSNGNGKPVQLHFSDLSAEWKIVSRHLSSPGEYSGASSKICREALDRVMISSLNPMPVWKRTVDIICALCGLVVISPILFLIALFIKISSPGPVFYKQERVGHMGKLFTMLKFRTMAPDNDSSIHQQHMSKLINGKNTPGSHRPMAKLENTSQITFIGKILRKTCLDELPQLINVLRGEMSLVGPRPPTTYEAKEYLQWHHGRFLAVPGITGLWQVSGKNQLTFPEMIRLDIQYFRNLSFWLDIKILLKTPLVIFSEIKDSFVSLKKSMPYMEVAENA